MNSYIHILKDNLTGEPPDLTRLSTLLGTANRPVSSVADGPSSGTAGSSASSRNLRLPFGPGDTSVGMEYELQVAVEGRHQDVDLPISIRSSTFFKNLVKRTARGDLDPSCLESLREFLFHNSGDVWENSWVRFSEAQLSSWSARLMATDMLADKGRADSARRGDIHRFRTIHRGRELLRLPVSYVLKLALANIISTGSELSQPLQQRGRKMLGHLLSDNTSPEILSFTVQQPAEGGVGVKGAEESARTYLFSQLLVQYANVAFGLQESGQRCLLYHAPHAPLRQKQLNEIVPDGYYRHLFMSPCLNGWDRGEEKHRYMELCHRTLSRSQLNTLTKLREAGIITNNLVVMPNTSTTCLANNGTHVSLGSRMLTELASQSDTGFTPDIEKSFGDLTIKIIEHFLPLLVNTYSASPYRIDFADFHPEKVLGFLPHELDYTHLRMVWRRWRKKAAISSLPTFGHRVTPFGPRWLDRSLATLLRLKGDIIPDYRLIDYLVTLLSTDTSPALNGLIGNQERLKDELGTMGVFDPRMSMYLLCRQRIFSGSGYSGFEGRSHSLFHDFRSDMAEAIDIQQLITALAGRYVLEGKIHHHDIPDRPSIESERRQIFFCCAIDIPTCYVRADTGNRFLKRILTHVRTQRFSRRYRGYIRITCAAYRAALLSIIEEDGADIIEQLGMQSRIAGLRARLNGEAPTAFNKLTKGVQSVLGTRRKPLNIPAAEFNGALERYLRTDLRRSHLQEGIEVLMNDCRRLELAEAPELTRLMHTLRREQQVDISAQKLVARSRDAILSESLDSHELARLLRISLAVIHEQSAPEKNNL